MDPTTHVAAAADAVTLADTDVSTSTFEELFATEHRALFRALYLITGSSFEAEELMQEAFLRIWERWDRVGGLESPVGYLYRTAMNLARNRFRRLALAARRTLSPGQPEDPFAAADLRDAVVRALRELSQRQREALVLTDLVGLSSEEAARMMGVRAGSVRSLASQARATLRHDMEPNDG